MQKTTWLDNVSLVENALIKNGSFNDGTTGYTIYVDSSAKASYVVDSLKDDNALAVTIKDTVRSVNRFPKKITALFKFYNKT